MALFCTVFDVFHFEKYCDLEIRDKGHSRSLKITARNFIFNIFAFYVTQWLT